MWIIDPEKYKNDKFTLKKRHTLIGMNTNQKQMKSGKKYKPELKKILADD
jgi:hypothetical protein